MFALDAGQGFAAALAVEGQSNRVLCWIGPLLSPCERRDAPKSAGRIYPICCSISSTCAHRTRVAKGLII